MSLSDEQIAEIEARLERDEVSVREVERVIAALRDARAELREMRELFDADDADWLDSWVDDSDIVARGEGFRFAGLAARIRALIRGGETDG